MSGAPGGGAARGEPREGKRGAARAPWRDRGRAKALRRGASPGQAEPPPDPPSRESYARTRRALDLPLEGDYGPEGVRQIRHEAGVAVATVKRKHASSAALALIDFLAEPCPDTARELFRRLAPWGYELEEMMIAETLGDPFQVVSEGFGIDAQELAKLSGVKPATVKRWMRGHGGWCCTQRPRQSPSLERCKRGMHRPRPRRLRGCLLDCARVRPRPCDAGREAQARVQRLTQRARPCIVVDTK